MSMTTLQKVTLISCSVLCVSLFLPKMLLPRGKKDVGQPEVGPGYYPPMMHRLQMPEEGLGQWMEGTHGSGPHSPEILAKAKGMGTLQIRGATKSNLISQAIPIYGFGILLYILFIIFKMTTRPKGKITKLVCRFPTMSSEAWQKKRTDDELAQLQEKLLETERVMERIISRRSSTPDSRTSSKVRRASKQEEKLLRKLSKISRVMQEVRLMEGATPEMEAEMVPYTADWEGYPEETYPQYEEPGGRRSSSYDPITIQVEPAADSEIPTAEALAEEVVDEEEEDDTEEEELQVCLPPPLEGGLEEKSSSPSRVKKQIRFSDHKDVFHYPKQDTVYEYRYEEVKEEEKEEEDEEVEEEKEEEEEQVDETEEEVGDEEDPLMEAEALRFSCDVCSNPEAEAEEEEYILLSQSEETDSFAPPDMAGELGIGSFLRMRNRRET
ncbi:protein RIC-3 isoform X1 [Oncorhynchus kisutch]|uniref:RIC3 acetylcholine receptor chaperone a n=1 Tax=Oncorhynchus kisutch TaxID=8019 RepID=A0A8C7M766_ONCKI|nr:protein RIC-3-like isoform X1 [Oncorhynchus kisutch]